MLIKTPKFWYQSGIIPSLLREILLPFSVFYYAGFLWKKHKTKPTKLSKPVICIGNVTVGGAGKTPTAIEIAKLLHAQKKNIAFLSRGYGGKNDTPIKVDPSKHTAADVGDEPLLLAKISPTYICKRRAKAGELAIRDGADILILDDGLQHFALEKDISIVVVDGQYGFGNTGIFPGGPLREPLHKICKRLDAVLVINEHEKNKLDEELFGVPVHRATLTPDFKALEKLDKDTPYLAFAGIGLPDKFFYMLRKEGFSVKHTESFADHYPYTTQEIKRLKKQAKELGAKLITTEKDYIRLPEGEKDGVNFLPVTLDFDDKKAIEALFAKT